MEILALNLFMYVSIVCYTYTITLQYMMELHEVAKKKDIFRKCIPMIAFQWLSLIADSTSFSTFAVFTTYICPGSSCVVKSLSVWFFLHTTPINWPSTPSSWMMQCNFLTYMYLYKDSTTIGYATRGILIVGSTTCTLQMNYIFI